MKKIITILTVIFSFLGMGLSAYSQSIGGGLNLYLTPIPVKEVPDRDPVIGKRIPGQHIKATISPESGVCIDGVDSGDILVYEIYDTRGDILFTTSDEEDFIDLVFSSVGEVEIHIITRDICYVGYVYLE